MKLVIFGIGSMAEQCHYYFQHRSDHEVIAFTADDEFVTSAEHLGLPLVPFSAVADHYRPDEYGMFVAVGYKNQNKGRQAKIAEARAAGYRLASFVDPSALVLGNAIGENCLIAESVVIKPFAVLGDGVFVTTKSIVGHHNVVGDNVYVGPGVVMSGFCTVGNRVFLGAGSILRDKTSIAEGCSVAMGAVVTRSLVKPGLYAGCPARLSRKHPQP